MHNNIWVGAIVGAPSTGGTPFSHERFQNRERDDNGKLLAPKSEQVGDIDW